MKRILLRLFRYMSIILLVTFIACTNNENKGKEDYGTFLNISWAASKKEVREIMLHKENVFENIMNERVKNELYEKHGYSVPDQLTFKGGEFGGSPVIEWDYLFKDNKFYEIGIYFFFSDVRFNEIESKLISKYGSSMKGDYGVRVLYWFKEINGLKIEISLMVNNLIDFDNHTNIKRIELRYLNRDLYNKLTEESNNKSKDEL